MYDSETPISQLKVREFRQLIHETIKSRYVKLSELKDLLNIYDKEQVLNSHQVADLFHVSRATVERWALAGKIPKKKIQGTLLFYKKDLYEFL